MSSIRKTSPNCPVDLYVREESFLAPLASRSATATRRVPEELPALRTPYQRDRDRIIHSKSFRRLMHKTQVFIVPSGDHVRTRLTHTLEVAQIARTIGRALGLNEDLVEAIGMGHDLGHTPFGHAGERALASIVPGFRHNEQSLRIVDKLERDGQGLNLTEPVRDGILRHSKSRNSLTGEMAGTPATLEGMVLKIADGVAYLNHDLDDAIRAREVQHSDIPESVVSVLGDRHSIRIDTMVADIVASSNVSAAPGTIAMSAAVLAASDTLRGFLYERVYDPINARPETLRVQGIVTALFQHFLEHPAQMPDSIIVAAHDDTVERQVTDYVASMTDRYAVELFERLFVPHFLAP
ncbi:MAG: deoxyguanosinetriphosphate triphosphohydrolase [Thermomicrobiales bacterium]